MGKGRRMTQLPGSGAGMGLEFRAGNPQQLQWDTTSGFGTRKCFENPIHGRRSPENSLSRSQNHTSSADLLHFPFFSAKTNPTTPSQLCWRLCVCCWGVLRVSSPCPAGVQPCPSLPVPPSCPGRGSARAAGPQGWELFHQTGPSRSPVMRKNTKNYQINTKLLVERLCVLILGVGNSSKAKGFGV